MLIGAIICLSFVSGLSSELDAFKIGLITASFVLLVALLTFLRHQQSQETILTTAFAHLHTNSTIPTFLSDRLGKVLAVNNAWHDNGPDDARQIRNGDRNCAQVLSRITTDGDALAYRVMRQVELSGSSSEEIMPSGSDRTAETVTLRVSPVGNVGLIWTVEAVPHALSDVLTSPSLGFGRRCKTGLLVEMNPTFARLSTADQENLANACSLADPDSRSAVIALSDKNSVLAEFGKSGPDGSRPILFFEMQPELTATQDHTALMDNLPIALATLSLDGTILSMNTTAQSLLGAKAKVGVNLADLTEGLGRPIPERIADACGQRSSGRADLARRRDRSREVYLRIALNKVDQGETSVLIAVINDATEMETKERQFIQSQKMQAVGQLAGGVAHDFNNLLTAILGHCDLIALRQSQTDPDYDDLMQIRQNANRAAGLVRQLLAFSRQQKLNPTATSLRDTLADLSHLLNRLIGERISLSVECEEQLWPVWIDQQQFDQVVMNLVVNARDAMPDGGQITIECENRTIKKEMRRDRAIVPVGDYVAIVVSDQGAGMSDTVRTQVFEPFFTTKKVGEGTGLGLSTAYGIVKQTGGFIFIDSESGTGTVFTILLPRLKEDAKRRAPAAPVEPQAMDLTGAGHILLVEDEAPVRSFAARALRLRGYDVTEAEHAEAALTILANGTVDFDLVVSDVVMPGLDGPSWVREARETHPELGVIFTSGYSEDVFRSGLKDLGDCGFLAKPFSLDALTTAVKTRLSAEIEPSSAA